MRHMRVIVTHHGGPDALQMVEEECSEPKCGEAFIKRSTGSALPVTGGYAEFVCLPQSELIPVPVGLGAAEAVSLVMNCVTAHQMLHRSAQVSPGRRHHRVVCRCGLASRGDRHGSDGT